MSTKDDGGPAFPRTAPHPQNGMTLRQWYAGMAMQGLLADEGMDVEGFEHNAARKAFAYADAMIAEEKKGNYIVDSLNVKKTPKASGCAPRSSPPADRRRPRLTLQDAAPFNRGRPHRVAAPMRHLEPDAVNLWQIAVKASV